MIMITIMTIQMTIKGLWVESEPIKDNFHIRLLLSTMNISNLDFSLEK